MAVWACTRCAGLLSAAAAVVPHVQHSTCKAPCPAQQLWFAGNCCQHRQVARSTEPLLPAKGKHALAVDANHVQASTDPVGFGMVVVHKSGARSHTEVWSLEAGTHVSPPGAPFLPMAHWPVVRALRCAVAALCGCAFLSAGRCQLPKCALLVRCQHRALLSHAYVGPLHAPSQPVV